MSLVHATTKLDKFEKAGHNIFIRLGEKQVEHEGEEGSNYTEYTFYQAKVSTKEKLTRNSIIEAIMRAKYETYGAELAAQLNGEDEKQEHTNWRVLAKQTADELMLEFFSVMNG